jgi:FlaA1/EpsC-like NDP-sugar epimerase
MLLPNEKTPRWVVLLIDLTLITLSISISFILRFEFIFNLIKVQLFEIYVTNIVVFLFVKCLIFILFGVYQNIVRYTSLQDMKKIFFAISTISIFAILLNLFSNIFNTNHFLPTSIVIVDFFVSIFLIIGIRLTIKILFIEFKKRVTSSTKTENVIIYGAGVSGLITKRTIEKDSDSNFKIVCFIDDSLKLKNTRLQGTKIYHTDQYEQLVKSFNVKSVIIAMQKPDYEFQNKIINLSIKNSVSVLKVPSSKSWINGDFSTTQIKNIKIEDLLGRNPIYLNPDKINEDLKDKVILVTGAAGSIGSGIVKQITNYKPSIIILLDQAESPLYDLEQELIQMGVKVNFDIVIGDVSNKIRMERVFEFYKPEIVFHAAAYKHVPLMEDNPSEAIYTNVLGTKNLVDLSVNFNVHKFVLISTDKAVNPTNVMGASKRIAEIYAQSSTNTKTKFITTRFGNVLGSNGSVIPLFKKQIEQGGPITITDARVNRFFMTIPEACQLVLEAGTMGEGGEIFVFDMGESVKIIDLAKKMIRLSGLVEGKDIEIKVTGLRPGEKLYEELLSKEENTIPTHHPKILKAKIRDNKVDIKKDIELLIELFDNQNNIQIVSLMKKIVPEYISNNSEFSELDNK